MTNRNEKNFKLILKKSKLRSDLIVFVSAIDGIDARSVLPTDLVIRTIRDPTNGFLVFGQQLVVFGTGPLQELLVTGVS